MAALGRGQGGEARELGLRWGVCRPPTLGSYGWSPTKAALGVMGTELGAGGGMKPEGKGSWADVSRC